MFFLLELSLALARLRYPRLKSVNADSSMLVTFFYLHNFLIFDFGRGFFHKKD